jgi:hypothetical protein
MCLVDGKWIESDLVSIRWNDRHFCVTMDVNSDGRDDLICTVGAVSGRGKGYTELYMTLPNGTLNFLKGVQPHGLQKYPTMRTRVAAALRNNKGTKTYVFIGTQGSKREDGGSNLHRMFRNVYTRAGAFPYFVEVPGPWTSKLFPATCAHAGDFTGDRRDDLIVCDPTGVSLLVRQGLNHQFTRVAMPTRSDYVKFWKKVRLADVTGDGRVDLVVITSHEPRNFVRVFKGQKASPYFDFKNPYYERTLKWTATDVEVLDVNRDGTADLYVVQVNDAKGQFCGPHKAVVTLPDDVIPPRDGARDLLLLGNGRNGLFTAVEMQHSQPGCGSIAQRWDARTMLLSQGGFNHPGYHLLLEW